MQLGAWNIQPYTLRIAYGVLVALIWLGFAARARGLPYRRSVSLLWSVWAGVLLVGRSGYVLVNVDYFVQRPWDVLALRSVGGMHGFAIWIGGALGGWLWARAVKVSWRATFSLLAPAGLWIAAGGWWACADRGCVWSEQVMTSPLFLRWLVVDRPDLYHAVLPRYPIADLAAVWALLCAGVAMLWCRHSLVGVGLYALGIAGLSTLRADPVSTFGPLRLEIVLHLLLFGSLLWLELMKTTQGKRQRFNVEIERL